MGRLVDDHNKAIYCDALEDENEYVGKKLDLVEVVRCKDCKWFNDIGCAMHIVDDSDKPKDDDYCSFGERRDEVKGLTKEEAITIISDMRSEYNLSCDPKEVPKYHALSMAIEALRDKLRIEEMQSNW